PPVYPQRRIVPADAELVVAVVVLVDQIRHEGVFQRDEAMGDAARDVKAHLARAEVHDLRGAAGRRVGAKVVERGAHPPRRHRPEVGLLEVVVHAAQHTGPRPGAIALDHLAHAGNPRTAEGLVEVTARVSEPLEANDVYPVDVRRMLYGCRHWAT